MVVQPGRNWSGTPKTDVVGMRLNETVSRNIKGKGAQTCRCTLDERLNTCIAEHFIDEFHENQPKVIELLKL